MAASYWQRNELVESRVSFPTIVFVMPLCSCHRKFVYTALMAMDEIFNVYETDAAHITLHHNNAYSPYYPFLLIQKKRNPKVLMTISTLIVSSLCISICVWKRFRFELSLMRVCLTVPSFQMVTWKHML